MTDASEPNAAAPPLYGVLGEFTSAQALLKAAEAVRDRGLNSFDCYSPFPVPGLDEAMGLAPTRLPRLVLLAAAAGAALAYAVQWYSATQHYPLNVGGRPLHSWPAFVPITFELAVLLAALAAVVGMIVRNGLPRPHHPVFNVHRFRRASQDRFFLALTLTLGELDRATARAWLRSLGAAEVYDIEA